MFLLVAIATISLYNLLAQQTIAAKKVICLVVIKIVNTSIHITTKVDENRYL